MPSNPTPLSQDDVLVEKLAETLYGGAGTIKVTTYDRQTVEAHLTALEAHTGPLVRQSDVQELVEAAEALREAAEEVQSYFGIESGEEESYNDAQSHLGMVLARDREVLRPFTTTPDETPSTESGDETDG